MSEKAFVDPNTCTGCGICVDSCEKQAIEMKDNIANVEKDKCTSCKVCVDICPMQAISLK